MAAVRRHLFAVQHRPPAPLPKKKISLAIFSFLAHWDSFVWPLLIIHKRDLYTVPLGLTYFQSEYIAYWNEQMAASLLALVPTFAMVFGFQRYYVQGVVMSGIKG